jgi:outer membrane protein assembly factor BamB
MKRLIFGTFGFLILIQAGFAGDWPQWRGPDRDGVAKNETLPTHWPKEFPKPLWQATVGEGFSSPVISRGRLYIKGRVPEQTEVCYCFDSQTGKLQWSHRYTETYKPPDPGAGAGPKSTPLVDEDRVYMLGAAGMFHCFDATTGRVLWKKNFKQEYWGVKKDKEGDDSWWPVCGAATSPVVDGNQLIVPVGGEKAGAITAFDKLTGKLLWKSLDDRSTYASPMLAKFGGVPQLVSFTGIRMVGVDGSSGALLWEHPFKANFEQTIITPVIWRDLVTIGGENRATVALRIEAGRTGLDKKVAWKNEDLRSGMISPVVWQNRLLGLNELRRQLVAVDLETGKTDWIEEDVANFGTLVVASDHLFVLKKEGFLLVFKLSPQGATRLGEWRVSEKGEVWSHLALAHGKLYIKDVDGLYCFELPAEKKR